jgi:hypothetical protein
MMTIGEIGRLFAQMSLGDNRKLPDDEEAADALLLWWHKQIGDLDYDAASAAIDEHQRDSTEYLTAAHIRARVKENREAALSKAAFQLRNLHPPQELAGDPAAERRWINEQHALVAGVEPRRELEAGH